MSPKSDEVKASLVIKENVATRSAALAIQQVLKQLLRPRRALLPPNDKDDRATANHQTIVKDRDGRSGPSTSSPCFLPG